MVESTDDDDDQDDVADPCWDGRVVKDVANVRLDMSCVGRPSCVAADVLKVVEGTTTYVGSVTDNVTVDEGAETELDIEVDVGADGEVSCVRFTATSCSRRNRRRLADRPEKAAERTKLADAL